MSIPRPRLPISQPRPLSAIFVGKLNPPKEVPSSTERTTYLPSPPHTNSNGSGSTGDSGTVGRQATRSGTIMNSSSSDKGKRPESRSSYNDYHEDEDDRYRHKRIDDYDEDNTARLSDDKRSTGTGSSGSAISRSNKVSGGALSRAKSLADRNRIVLDKLASITSGSRTNSKSPPQPQSHRPFSREPSPLMPKSLNPHTLSPSPSLLSFSRSRSEVDLVSGSDTEKERQISDDYSRTRRSSPVRGSVRRRMVSAPSPPPTSGTRPNTVRQYTESREEPLSISRRDEDTLAAPFGTSRYKKNPRRAPLPQEFRDGGTQSSEERVCYFDISHAFLCGLRIILVGFGV